MKLGAEHYQALAGFRLALRQFLAASEGISRSSGITQQQYQAMLAIKTWPSQVMNMSDLADQLLLTHHATVQLVNRLTKANLAKRTPSKVDRRSVLLTLTPNGEAMVDRLASEHLREVLRQEPQLSRSLRRLRRFDRDEEGDA